MQLSKRQRRLAAQKELTKGSPVFEPIDLAKASKIPPGMTRAFRNNRFTVMVYDGVPTTHGPAIRAMVQKHDDTPIDRHWRTLWDIKNEIFGFDAVAVEYYPRLHDLVDKHNIYWLFIYPNGVLPEPL